ncbi:MAG: DNA/RNA nuclease SfsA [Balneola sp.]
MEIKKEILYKNLEELALQQIAEEYQSKGYKISREVSLGKFRADLIAFKDKEKIIFEVKTTQMSSFDKKRLAEFTDYINTLENCTLRILIARPPKDKKIIIDGFEELLLNYLISNMPHELDEISTHTIIDSISDLEIHELLLREKNVMRITGFGVIDVELQFGSGGDQRRGDGHIAFDSFPFDFNLEMELLKEYIINNDKSEVLVNLESYYS